MQVRDQMRSSKETLQKLAPATAAAAKAAAASQLPDEADDDDAACVICLDQPASILFHPCSHCVTCPACTSLLAQRKQPCPLCRTPVASTQQLPAAIARWTMKTRVRLCGFCSLGIALLGVCTPASLIKRLSAALPDASQRVRTLKCTACGAFSPRKDLC